MQINFTLAVIIFLILFLVFPTLMIVVFFNNKKVLKIVGIVCFVLYCVALACLVFGRVSIKNNVASLTFETNSKWFSSYFIWGSFGKTNVIYNLIMFFPVSAFIISQTKNKIFLKTLLTSFIMTIIIESFQFILPIVRNTEVLDIVLNTISGIIGYLYFKVVYFVAKKIREKPENKTE